MMKPYISLIGVLSLTLLFLSYQVLSWPPEGEQLEQSTMENSDLLQLFGTGGRLRGESYFETSITFSQTIYPAHQDQDRPGAVVLVRDDEPAVAMATTRLQHFPVNAPMLYITDNGTRIPEETEKELKRLGPDGVMMDGNVQVYLVGNIGKDMEKEIKDMKLKTKRIHSDNVYDYTEKLDEYIAVMEANHYEVVHLAHVDHLEYAYCASNWNAHHGDGFAFLNDNGIPDETRNILQRRWPHYAYIYVFAPASVVPDEVLEELTEYGYVVRIPGKTPQEMSVRWAGFKDPGRRVAWWFGYETRGVGWGYAEPGHNVILANPSIWQEIVPSGVLSHMGKHAFLILTETNGSLSKPSEAYLNILKPMKTHPSQQPFNFGWVIGQGIPDETVAEFDQLLGVDG